MHFFFNFEETDHFLAIFYKNGSDLFKKSACNKKLFFFKMCILNMSIHEYNKLEISRHTEI